YAMNKVSFIISSIGKSEKMDELVDYLIANFKTEEIIIIDNSIDKNLESKFKKRKKINYYYEQTSGLSNARNRGAKEAKNPILIFLDDDIIPTDFFKLAVNRYKKNDGILGIVGGRIIVKNISKSLPKKYHYMTGEKCFGDKIKILSKRQNLGGCCLLIEKKLFNQIGGFNCEYGHKNNIIGANEDVLLQQKIRKNKFKVIYDPQFEVIHFWNVDYEGIKERLIVQGKNDYMLDKNNNKLEFIMKNIKYRLCIMLKVNIKNQTNIYDIERYKAYVYNSKRKKN
ncbi:MAG: glycosyltransferase, partial [Clostridia bacterium]